MSGAPARGTVPRRQRRHHRHHHHHHHHQPKHQKQAAEEETPRDADGGEPEGKRPKVNPIFLWASQREQRIVEVRCEDYDKRNRIKLTKTAQGWRSIPRTTSNVYSIALATAAGAACKTRSPVDSPASSVSSNDEKENGKCVGQETAANSHQRLPARVTGVEGKKRRYEDAKTDENRRGYPLGVRDDSNRNAVQGCSEDGGKDGDEEKRDAEAGCERNILEDCLLNSTSQHRPMDGGWVNLERLQKDKLFQPRVVLEQLHLSRLLEGAHQGVVCPARERKDGATSETERTGRKDDEEDATDEAEEEAAADEKDGEKRRRVNKAGIQDILNMIDATASPVLAADTPSADLPVDSTKTYEEVLDEGARKRRCVDKRARETKQPVDNARDRPRSSYQVEAVRDDDGADDVDEKPEVNEEKMLEDYTLDVEEKKICVDDEILLSLKNNPETVIRSCKVAEADGGLVNSRSNSLVTWHSVPSEMLPSETEEEAPDEPGEPLKIDYNDSSRLLDALRNTPGLSVSVMRSAPETGSNKIAPPARPASKASSSSRSPDSQAECVEKLLKNVDSRPSTGFLDNTGCTISPRNLPGLSIIIPNYRYRSAAGQLSATSPCTKRRVESPESTVSFNKTESNEVKLDVFPHEEEDEEEEEGAEDEDDCDSQVLEDLRRQKADSLVYDGVDTDYYNGKSNTAERKTPLENAKGDQVWTGSNRSSEAQAKCKYQDLEHFDEQVLEELRSRGTVVSPQPSGIPCSPASRRPSSAYLERLLPSPPCSVSCSEDAKSELTLKGILASSNCAESRDCERSKETTRAENQAVELGLCRVVHSSADRNVAAARRANRSFQERPGAHNQEARNPGRPMSSGDIHSSFYTADRAAPKRPMSAEWSTGRHRSQTNYYQRIAGKTARSQFAEHLRDACATSSSTDRLSDPASQLRELIETAGHLIPDPLLVPRDYLPGLAAAPATEIPKLLATRPELRLPEALTRPDLLRDPDLLVISLAHLQHVLDHGEGPVSRSRQPQPARVNNGRGSGHSNGAGIVRGPTAGRPKLSCKPIGTLMPAPMDLSSSRARVTPYPPLLRVRTGLLKQEPEVSSTASSPDESQLWHPLFGSQKRQQQQQSQQHHPLPQQQQHQQQRQHVSWHRTTLAS
ncbi:PREDICTED: uncharacterized protein LOC106751399 isoform X2 [Dinoponera quadriceps]|uniref:Uncharacterized protein LOC106751399 isoform X2 n=1 Tax=Dinoponera quadriceps TaxID=609295 RepID=A0A6P3YBL0_DINQU|nr:PREDICTED: uncharacterized protein LOC106751399 isoform X2 [Dinoponera quadriceps]